MRVLLTGQGTAGDLYPLLDVGCELRDRGHAVTALVHAEFVDTAAAAGLDAVELDGALAPSALATERRFLHPTSGPLTILRRGIAPTLDRVASSTREVLDDLRSDLVIGNPLALHLPAVLRDVEATWATLAPSPAAWISLHDFTVYPGMPDRDHYFRGLVRALVRGGRWLTTVLTDPPLQRALTEAGLTPGRRLVVDATFRADVVLGLWSAHLRPAAADDPPRSTICGFTWFDDDAPGPADEEQSRLGSFLDDGAPPILVTLGSGLRSGKDRLSELAPALAETLGHRIVVLGVEGGDAGLVFRARRASHSALMPRCAAVVHHGGIGTAAHALRAGRPTVTIPFAFDQFDTAARLRRLGVSRTVERRKLTVSSLADALRSVLHDRAMAEKAETLSRDIARENGAARAANLLEEATPRANRGTSLLRARASTNG